jgi:hypothetical protein
MLIQVPRRFEEDVGNEELRIAANNYCCISQVVWCCSYDGAGNLSEINPQALKLDHCIVRNTAAQEFDGSVFT